MGNVVQYGDFVFTLVQDISRPMAVRERTAETPGRQGVFSAGGLSDARKYSVRALQPWNTATETRTEALRSLYGNLREGRFLPLYLHEDADTPTQYALAECIGVEPIENNSRIGAIEFTAVFLVADPWYYDATEIVANLSNDGEYTMLDYDDATAACRVRIEIPITYIPPTVGDTQPGYKITTFATGEETFLFPPAQGTLDVDIVTNTANIDGTIEQCYNAPFVAPGDLTRYFIGVWPEMQPFVDNGFKIEPLDSDSVFPDNHQIKAYYRKRYR